jgi:hypothetical protein
MLTPIVNVSCFSGVSPAILKSILDYKSHLIADADIRITDFDALRNSINDCEKPIEDEKEEKEEKDSNNKDEQRNSPLDLSSPILTEELGDGQ